MAGYNHRRGMSNNAVDAYRRNEKPISRFTAQDLRDADINISLGFARWMARKKHWRHVARHHSSKFYKFVRFYDLASLRQRIEDLGTDQMDELRQHYLRHLAAKRRQARKGLAPVQGEYAQFAGPVGRRHVVAWVPFEGELDGKGWIHLPDGSKKKARTKWVKFKKVNRKPSTGKRRRKKKRDGAEDRRSTGAASP